MGTTSKDDLILCSTTDCLFKISSQTKCIRYIDDCNHCANYKRTSIYVNDVDKIDSDNIEIVYDDTLNEDCVTVFQNSDEGTSIKSADNAIMSLGCNTVYNSLPNYKCKVPEYIINILDDDFVIPPIEHVEAVINNGSLSVIGNLILDLFISESVSGLREPFIMKDENYNNSNGTTRRLENTTEIVSEDEIKIMNLNWKNSIMISFSTWGGKSIAWFLSWHLWMNEKLNVSVVERYDVFVPKKNEMKRQCCLKNYIMIFLKLKLIRFYIAKSKTLYYNKDNFFLGHFFHPLSNS